MLAPTVLHSCWNTLVEPVKWIPARSGCASTTSEISGPWPGSMLITPSGSPASCNRSITSDAASCCVIDGFHTTTLPISAGNLPTAPALIGNVVVWEPSLTQQLAASLVMDLLQEAGLPDGVINMLPGQGPEISEVVLAHPDLAGIHFTGSTRVFQQLWRTVGANIAGYRSYPRLVGETGGKDFVVAHPSADLDVLRTALVRGAFEYSGQKCSAASRAYIPNSLWTRLRDGLAGETEALTIGSVEDFSNFSSAVIDDRSFGRLQAAIDRAQATDSIEVLAGGCLLYTSDAADEEDSV